MRDELQHRDAKLDAVAFAEALLNEDREAWETILVQQTEVRELQKLVLALGMLYAATVEAIHQRLPDVDVTLDLQNIRRHLLDKELS
jgi:hypothetical protein